MIYQTWEPARLLQMSMEILISFKINKLTFCDIGIDERSADPCIIAWTISSQMHAFHP